MASQPELDPDERQVEEWSRRLRLWMVQKGRSQRWVEKQAGWGVGYLSQLLRPSPPDLKVRQVFTILRVLEVPPEIFFAGIYDLKLPGSDSDASHMSREELKQFVSRSIQMQLAKLLERAISAEEEPLPLSEGSSTQSGQGASDGEG